MKKILAYLVVYILVLGFISGCSPGSSPSGSPSPSGSSSSKSSKSGSSSGASDGSSSSEESSEEKKNGNISASGSIALQPLLTQAVGTYKTEMEFTGAITIDGGSSLKGIADVAAGKVDIGNSDISPMQAGLDDLELVDHQIAVVAVGIVVSTDVAANLEEITTSDLKSIYTGKIDDWKQVAGWKGKSVPITGYYMKSGSGIRYIFDTYGIAATGTDAQIGEIENLIEIDSPASLQTALESDKGIIGYAALPYCTSLTLLKVDSVEASYENVYSGEYKMWGCEHMYTKGEPMGAAKAFIEYLTSPDIEETIIQSGYGLISEMKVSR